MSSTANLSRLTIDISKEDHKKLKTIAALKDTSMRDIILESVELYLQDFDVSEEITRLPRNFPIKQA